MTGIAVFLFDGAEELDWAGPWEVLRVWQQLWPGDGAEVFNVARDGGEVRCANGLRVVADHSWATAPPIDVLVYPGGPGTRTHIGDETIHDWLRDLAGRGTMMTSVCTGSLVYADAGLLDGRPAATHWAAIDSLASLGRGVQPRPEDRFVDDGQVLTAAGVSAGIDLALHLVGRLAGRERAAEVRRWIQYDPTPPL